MSFVLRDREKKPIRFHFTAPRGMEFVRFETTANPKNIWSMRNILINLDDQLYSPNSESVAVLSPDYENVYSEASAGSAASTSTANTVVSAISSVEPDINLTQLPIPPKFLDQAQRIFKKRKSVFPSRPVMQKVDSNFLSKHEVNIESLPDIPPDFSHSMRFWLCVRYIEALLRENRAFKYTRICQYFGVLDSSVKRIVKYNLKHPSSVKTPVYFNLYSPEELNGRARKKLVFEFGEISDIARFLELEKSKQMNYFSYFQ